MIVFFKTVIVEPLGENIVAARNHRLTQCAQTLAEPCAGLCGHHVFVPFGERHLCFGSKHFHLVAAFQLGLQRHELMVDFSGDAVQAYFGVEFERKVEYGSSGRKCDELTRRGEYYNLRSE